MKIRNIAVLSFAVLACACSGGSGDGGEKAAVLPSISFTEGLPPASVEGCFKATATVVTNNCESLNAKGEDYFCLDQDDANGAKATFYDSVEISSPVGGGAGTIVGYGGEEGVEATVSGNQFKAEKSYKTTSATSDCTVEALSLVVGKVENDSVSGSQQLTIKTNGNCTAIVNLSDCSASLDFSGKKYSDLPKSLATPQEDALRTQVGESGAKKILFFTLPF